MNSTNLTSQCCACHYMFSSFEYDSKLHVYHSILNKSKKNFEELNTQEKCFYYSYINQLPFYLFVCNNDITSNATVHYSLCTKRLCSQPPY